MICTCGRPGRYRGKTLCHACYERNRRAGVLALIPARTAENRFFDKVISDDPASCWTWQGAVDDGGYGVFRGDQGKVSRAHRWSYELLRAEIPPGLVLDHLCRQRACVNPWHLEPVTVAENTQRGDGTYHGDLCRRGHSLADAVWYRNRRQCRGCIRDNWHKRAQDPAFLARHAAKQRACKARNGVHVDQLPDNPGADHDRAVLGEREEVDG